ncbi:acetyl-CoA hydrolase/transferase C-terminal domain-containing protein [Parachitinimonas caeni]|uniref:Acetyl-CoA hydrolase/transferase C-terminal domain-containing protein n=1 Tax=Parachitinimonas caeni TaxID=3031301 RepID=A0ABT7DXB3_9NEIS|nr:acetyl-CoA hydrolase/transferase C-terminal domain-containing protein [Parachitinimonas caeni]MDK2124676.1 acetyl-CoA hydrolase/transferase C-terminal domain-containing protein [Parachitinimonas caeni]
MPHPDYFDSIETAVDAVITETGNRIVLGIPLGIGKPNTFVNALYQRVKDNPVLHLTIFTALSLERPQGHSELEKRFLEPFAERVFGDYPDLDYVIDLRNGSLPSNVEVCEFFLKTGEYLNNANAQQHYVYSNYSHAARDMLLNGVNVLAQAVAAQGEGDTLRLSLSSNPDVTLDALDLLRAEPLRKVLTVAVINDQLPYMPNDAEVDPALFNFIVTDPKATHDLFAPPNMKVTAQDYAIGVHASSLVKDGGTLQIGIGSLGDAICQALIVRHQEPARYNQLLCELSGGTIPTTAETGPFDLGLYGCSEMLVNGFLHLMEAGIIKREVFSDAPLQTLLDQGRISLEVRPVTLMALLEAGLIQSPLTAANVEWLVHFGIFREGIGWRDGMIVCTHGLLSSRLDLPEAFDALVEHCLGDRLKHGTAMHGGFFLGPRDFYQRLRDMPREQLSKICMSRIGYINQLYGQEQIARIQRRDARFINTTMMVTLLGAAVSDSLDSGQLVSGVGGQYNFVAMAHALPGARSILMLRATRLSKGEVRSNIVWNYAHTTIPRHLRDMVITEYGVADLRGRSDSEVIKRLLAITDSRFQDELLAAAKENGKIETNYQIPEEQRLNLPEVLENRISPWQHNGVLPDFPFGTDFTEDELVIIRALQRLKHAADSPISLARSLFKGLFNDKPVPERYLERLGLDETDDIKLGLLKRLFVGNF